MFARVVLLRSLLMFFNAHLNASNQQTAKMSGCIELVKLADEQVIVCL